MRAIFNNTMGDSQVTGRHSPLCWLPWVLAAITGLDYFDSALFSFFAGHIAARLHTTPDEIIWAASAYAALAVLGILQQQWWVDRLGYRRYLVACLLVYTLGALAATLSPSAFALALARGLQGYCIGPTMGACRILIQLSFTAERRSNATRVFLLAIMLGSALAPLAGGTLITLLSWRGLFAFTIAAGLLCAWLAWRVLPDTGASPPAERVPFHIAPYLAFVLAQGCLQIALQQYRLQDAFNWLAEGGLIATGLAALLWFIYHQWEHPKPFIRLHLLRERVFQAGLAIYVFYYFITTNFSYLTARLLERGLDFSIAQSGHLVGLTALMSVPLLFAYFRYARQLAQKKWLMVPGFLLAALAAAWLAHTPPQAGATALIGPLLLRGALLLSIVLPAANVTFRIFETEDYTHSYRLKNIIKQMAVSFATASALFVEKHRLALHRVQLGVQEGVAPHALSPAAEQHAAFLTALDGFTFLAVVAVVAAVFACWQRQID